MIDHEEEVWSEQRLDIKIGYASSIFLLSLTSNM